MVDMSLLHPTLQAKIKELEKLCNKNGLKIRITQGLRTVAEQDALYAQGRTKPGNKVTNAKGGYSMHNWGVAFDFCRDDGKNPYDDSDGFFTKVGRLGVSIGLEWGGNWKSPVDKPHLQLPDWGSTTSILRSQYKTPEKFFSTWKYVGAEFGNTDLPEEKYRLIKDSFLRSEPKVERNKISYSELSTTVKKKCTNKGGYALFKAGSTFIRVKSTKDSAGNKWFKTKSGHWLPAIFDGEKRVEKI